MRDNEPLVLEREIRRRRARPQVAIAAAAVAGVAAITTVAYLFLRPKPDTFTLSSYTYREVVRRDMRDILQVSGVMDVEESQDIVAMQHGILVALAVEVGDKVRKGQLIARLSAKDLEDELAERENSLSKMTRDLDKLTLENRYTLARAERERPALEKAVEDTRRAARDAERLREGGFSSENDVKTAEDAESAAREALAKADADRGQTIALYELSRTNLREDIAVLRSGISRLEEEIGECTVYAPLDGTVLEIYADVGAWISQYQKLFHVADTGKAKAVLDVPETSINRLSLGQRVTVLCGSGSFDGVVGKIGLQAETGSSDSTPTVSVEVTLPHPPASVIPGSSASAEILLGVKTGALVLPRAPYLSSGEESVVYVIGGDSARRTQVTYGLISAEEVEVTSGLEEGDRVITSGYGDFIDRPLILVKTNGGKKQ